MQSAISPAIDPISISPSKLSDDMKKHTLKKLRSTKCKKYFIRVCIVCKTHRQRSKIRYAYKFREVPLHKGNSYTNYLIKRSILFMHLLKISIK